MIRPVDEPEVASQATSYDPAVRIVLHDPRWQEKFECEAAAVRGALGSVAQRVDHVGSTSVPGLPAKPIVDINVSVPDIMAVDSYRGPLERIGYLFVPVPESPDFHFFGKPAARPRTFHIHVCETGSLHERRQLAVRDYLRTHPEEAAAYGAVKRAIAERHPGDRPRYIAEKDPYVEALERRALVSQHSMSRPVEPRLPRP